MLKHSSQISFKRNRVWKRFLFNSFAYVENFLQFLLGFFPPILRSALFKVACKSFGKRVMIDYGSYLRYPHKIRIGNDVAINRGCQFFPSLMNKDAFIVLGDRVVLGPNVVFYGAGQDPRELDLPDIAQSITVESDVYIGGSSILRYGVTIGQGAVVAAGSVVVKDVEPWTIVGGNPARLISARNLSSDDASTTKSPFRASH